MTIVEQVLPIVELGSEYSTYMRDTITLAWDDRRQGHGRRTSDSGIEFAISLHAGTVLKNGDCFVLDPERAIIAVQEAEDLTGVGVLCVSCGQPASVRHDR